MWGLFPRTDAQRTALCDAALHAWRLAPPRARRVAFRWRGRAYVVRSTGFRLLIDTRQGRPVVCRWY